jgi:hypothetical protein
MWYHYIFILFGIWSIGSTLYMYLFPNAAIKSYIWTLYPLITNSIWLLVGVYGLYSGIVGVRTPAPVPVFSPTVMGGLRRFLK